jgi:hypothetical protein
MPFNERGEIIRGGTDSEKELWTIPLVVIAVMIAFSALTIHFSGRDKYRVEAKEIYAATQPIIDDTATQMPAVIEDTLSNDSPRIIEEPALEEKYNSYGSGKSKIVIYKPSGESGKVEIFIDGERSGTASNTYSYKRERCNDPSAFSKILSAGYHTLFARSRSFEWNFEFYIYEGQCLEQELHLREQDLLLSRSKFAKILDGRWYGKVYQGDVHRYYSVLLSCNVTKREFKINYPGLNYIGTMDLVRMSSNTLSFTANMLYASPKFNPGDDIEVTVVNENKIQLEYYTGGVLGAMAILYKVK